MRLFLRFFWLDGHGDAEFKKKKQRIKTLDGYKTAQDGQGQDQQQEAQALGRQLFWQFQQFHPTGEWPPLLKPKIKYKKKFLFFKLCWFFITSTFALPIAGLLFLFFFAQCGCAKRKNKNKIRKFLIDIEWLAPLLLSHLKMWINKKKGIFIFYIM